MAVAASKVRAVCTADETALVRASRKPDIETLGPADAKRLASKARKLADKWEDLARDEVRAQGRKVGSGAAGSNTQLKGQIFREALSAFEARIDKLSGVPATAARQAHTKVKQQKATSHRATRAAIRKGLKQGELLINETNRATKSTARKPAAKPASKSAPVAAPAAAPAALPAKRRSAAKPAKPVTPSARPAKSAVSPSAAPAVVAAAKGSRIARSGKTTRMLGHVSARGKRAQARRDAKN